MIRVVILQRRRLDRDALAALFGQQSEFELVASLGTNWETVTACKSNRPHLAILDVSWPRYSAASLAKNLLRNGYTRQVLFLGDEQSDAWTVRAAAIPSTAYISRQASFDQVLEYVMSSCGSKKSTNPARSGGPSEPTISDRRVDQAHLGVLTPREIEVLRLFAEGNTVTQCAEQLDLARTTIDNHKARMMKKLNIHRAVGLVRFAIREGLVRP